METQAFRPTLLDVPISYFEYDHQRDTFGNVPAQQTTLRRMGTTKFYRDPIEAIRAESDKTIQDTLKKQLPAFTPVAWLHHRRRDTSFSQKIRQQWPLLMGDVDKKDNPGINMAELKKHLTRLPYVLLCAYSVRGGLWFVVRLPDEQTPETLAAHFRYLQKLFSHKLGVKLDTTKGGNPTDLRFVSYDADPHVQEDATVMVGTYTPPPPKPRVVDYSRADGEDEGQLLAQLVRFTKSAGEGERHATLLKASKLAGGFVAAGRIDEQTAVYALETVASEWPTFSKSQKTIRDGVRYGLTSPVYPEAKPDRESYRTAQPFYAKTILPTAKPPIGTLAVGTIEIPPITAAAATEPIACRSPIFKPDESQLERLHVKPVDSYPAEWDEPSHAGAVPRIKELTFFEWQRKHPPFNQLGLASLPPKQQS
ncbi:BT4734/BF3469 family protein [Spirosoma jeollabukense]